MSLENPVKIDLSQDTSWDQVDDSLLTQEDKNYLKEQFSEESEGIIYLTQQELSQLKDVISLENSITSAPRGATDSAYSSGESLTRFIEKQKSEGLSSSDLFQGLEGNPEALGNLGDKFDEFSYETLFGENGVMNGIELSDTAKDNISVALTLSSVKQLNGVDNITIENYLEKNEELASSLKIIEVVSRQTQTTDEGDVPYEQALSISNNGEGNYIFMDAAEGIKLFDGIFSGEMNAETLEKYIEERNLPEGSTTEITHRMSAIREISGEQFRTLGESMGLIVEQDPGAGNDNQTVVEQVAEEFNELTEEEQLTLIEKLKKGNFMDQMLAAILEVMQNMGLYNDEDKEDETTTPEYNQSNKNIDLPPQELQANQELIDMIDALSPINQKHIETLQNNPALTTKIRKIMEGISINQTFEETFREVFDSGDILASNGIRAGKIFEEYEFEMSLPEGLSEIEKGVKMLEEYSRYRNSDGVRNLTSGRTLWVDWAKMRQAENWRVGGR